MMPDNSLAQGISRRRGARSRAPAPNRPPPSSDLLYGQILEWRGIGEPGDPGKDTLAEPRPDPAEKGQLPDRGVDRLFVHEKLHFVQDRFALLRIEFAGLLRIKRVDIGIAAIDI